MRASTTMRSPIRKRIACSPGKIVRASKTNSEELFMRSFIHTAAVALAAALIQPAVSTAQSDYPNKPIKLIVGFAPGGSTDIVARIVAQKLTERLGQSVVVENRAGAGGTIGADLTPEAAADGYKLTLGTPSPHPIAAGAYSKLPYDPVKDFTHISLVSIQPYLLVA